WQAAEMVMFGLDESADAIRQHFYPLSFHFEGLQLADLGNLQAQTNDDALREILALAVKQLLAAGKNVVMLGGKNEDSYGQLLGYEHFSEEIAYVHISNELHFNEKSDINARILKENQPCVSDFTHLGGQRYLIYPEELAQLSKYHVTIFRYGELRENMMEAEPALRDGNFISFDLNSLRFSDTMGGCKNAMPSGFSTMEAAILGKYAGGGKKVKTFSLHGLETKNDTFQQTAKSAATLLWYYVEGFTFHREEFSNYSDNPHIERFEVPVNASIEKIIFYHNPSEHSLRWWMEVPHDILAKNSAHSLIACTQKDYEQALSDEIPKRWWNAYERLSEG
ncbi:MAG: arginase family protein, partial [Bacteroidia bacterium]